MRVTQSMLNTQMLSNLNNNLSRMEKTQNQMSTGKQINKPSDDPVGISFSLRYRNNIDENEQYQRNTDAAISWVDYTERMISETNDVLQRARELAVYGANGTLTDQAMESIAQEVDQLYGHLVDVGNSKFNGKYIFNGQMTDVKPYDLANAQNVTPHQGDINLEVGIGITMPVNISGADLFGDQTDPTNAFRVLENLRDGLNAHDQTIVNQAISDIDARMDINMEQWSKFGAKSNRLDLIKNRLENESVNLTTLLSRTEDADMAELMVKMKAEENVYNASLSTGAKIIKPSLVDFFS